MALHFIVPGGTAPLDGSSWEGWGGDKKTLEKVTIPTTVEPIGKYAFSGCRALVEVAIPGSVESIGDDAFYGCSATSASALLEARRSLFYF